jgi:repressor LexA
VPRQSQSTPTSKRTATARTRASARKQADVAKVTDLSARRRGDGLTERQQVILDVIRDSVNKRGYPPSIREICEAAGLASTSSVAHQLSVL